MWRPRFRALSAWRAASGSTSPNFRPRSQDPMRDAPVVTIDGPSGSGKGTVSRAAAKSLGWALLDSGALYRLVALAGRGAGVSLDDEPGLARLAETADIGFGSTGIRAEGGSLGRK